MDGKYGKIIIPSFFVFFLIISLAACTDKRAEDEAFSGDYDPADLITIVQGVVATRTSSSLKINWLFRLTMEQLGKK